MSMRLQIELIVRPWCFMPLHWYHTQLSYHIYFYRYFPQILPRVMVVISLRLLLLQAIWSFDIECCNSGIYGKCTLAQHRLIEDVDTALDNYCHFLLNLWAKRYRKWQKWPKNIYLGKCIIIGNEKNDINKNIYLVHYIIWDNQKKMPVCDVFISLISRENCKWMTEVICTRVYGFKI